MKKSSILVMVCTTFVFLTAGQALGQYVSILHNLINGVDDTSYTAADGRLYISDNTNLITLNDPGPLTGTVSNGHVQLESFFDSMYVNGAGNNVGVFKGGSLSLTFDFNGVPHEISGPIVGMELEASSTSSTLSQLDGEGLWKAATVDLPGSNNWPDGGGFSSLTSLSLVFGWDISNFMWDQDTTGRVETSYTLWPDARALPEPLSLALMAFGTLGLLRRRRA